jgi:hypothetical protein
VITPTHAVAFSWECQWRDVYRTLHPHYPTNSPLHPARQHLSPAGWSQAGAKKAPVAPARATTVQTQAVVSMPATFTTVKSDAIFAEAQLLMPGGVSSPVRAFKSVGGGPVVFDRVKGAYAWDVDGNKYVDYIGTWGMLALSHSTTSSVHNCPPTSHGTLQGVKLGFRFRVRCSEPPALRAVRGWTHPPCRHFKTQSCCCNGFENPTLTKAARGVVSSGPAITGACNDEVRATDLAFPSAGCHRQRACYHALMPD